MSSRQPAVVVLKFQKRHCRLNLLYAAFANCWDWTPLIANEGKLVIAVERNAAEQVLAALHSHPLGKDAALIGEVVERKGVRLAGLYGVKRTLDLPHAEPLPRIC